MKGLIFRGAVVGEPLAESAAATKIFNDLLAKIGLSPAAARLYEVLSMLGVTKLVDEWDGG